MDQRFPVQDTQDLRRRRPAWKDQFFAHDDLFPEWDGEEDAEEGDTEGPREEGAEGQDEGLGTAVEFGSEHSESRNDTDETGGEGQSARRDGGRLQDDLKGVSVRPKVPVSLAVLPGLGSARERCCTFSCIVRGLLSNKPLLGSTLKTAKPSKEA